MSTIAWRNSASLLNIGCVRRFCVVAGRAGAARVC